jgi:hypothetical protein
MARCEIIAEMWSRRAKGKTTEVLSLRITADEDGRAGTICLEMEDLDCIVKYFQFDSSIDPNLFDARPYERAFFATPTAIH